MDPFLNPYAPGAGASPPELAGRDALLSKTSIALRRIASGRFGRSLILTGLRGVGKTVLLNRMRQDAEAAKIIPVRIEVPEGRSLPSLLIPGLKTALLKLKRGKAATNLILRGFQTLDESLSQVFQAVGLAAKEKKTAVVLFIDELHVLNEKQLAPLIMAFHVAAQDFLPITMVAAGLPQLPAKMGAAKTYVERLFEFSHIGQLEREAALQALVVPAKKLNISYTEDALEEILQQTQGYPYFLQEWGKHAWDTALTSPITQSDTTEATIHALADLDASFFRVRFDQLTAMQKRYLRAMAELGSGIHASGQIATVLNKKVTALGPIRDQLISKGLIYSPAHGETAFTVPLFDAFMKRMLM